MANKIGVVILCYNVENSIREVLRSFSPQTLQEISEILAIDNCSRDRTPGYLREAKLQADDLAMKLTIMENSANLGSGGSQKIAFQYFLDRGMSHVIVLHGDGQGNVDAIIRNFMEVLGQTLDIDVVFASRFMPGSDISLYNRWRTIGNKVFNLITWICTGHWMSDAGTGIILYRSAILRSVPFNELTDFLQFNPQLNILLRNLPGIKIREIPLSWRDSADRSNVLPGRYCWELLGMLWSYFVNTKIFQKPPSF